MTLDAPRILVLRYRFIGDTVLTVPFLRNLRRAEPRAFISWMVAPGSSDIIRGIPYVDELIVWDPVTIHADSRGAHRTFRAKLAFIRDLRRHHFDKAYVLKRSFSSALIAWLSGARERIGFATESRGMLLTTGVAYHPDRHEVENFLDVLRADNVPVTDDRLELWPTRAEAERAVQIMASAGVGADEPVIAVHPFSAVTERGWPLERFAELVARLVRSTGYRSVILGGSRDREAFDAVKRLFPEGTVDLVGACTVRETAALLGRSVLFVGNDSGIMHIAAAAGTPLVALFGPQSPVRFGPWSSRARVLYKHMACSPCRQKFFTECEPSARMRPPCMEAITVDEVLQECRAVADLPAAPKGK